MTKHQHKKRPKERILTVDPTHRGFAYALCDGTELIDVSKARKNEETLERPD